MDIGPLDDTQEMTPLDIAERDEDGGDHLPKVKVILTMGYYRTLRWCRLGCSMFVAMLVILLKQVSPTGFAVIVAVLAGVGLYAIMAEVIFSGFIKEEKD